MGNFTQAKIDTETGPVIRFTLELSQLDFLKLSEHQLKDINEMVAEPCKVSRKVLGLFTLVSLLEEHKDGPKTSNSENSNSDTGNS